MQCYDGLHVDAMLAAIRMDSGTTNFMTRLPLLPEKPQQIISVARGTSRRRVTPSSDFLAEDRAKRRARKRENVTC